MVRVHPLITALKLCVCAGICAVDSVVAPDVDEAIEAINPTVPPLLTDPDTTRNAESLSVRIFVHPVGAAVCTNSIFVPVGNTRLLALTHDVPLLKRISSAGPGGVTKTCVKFVMVTTVPLLMVTDPTEKNEPVTSPEI